MKMKATAILCIFAGILLLAACGNSAAAEEYAREQERIQLQQEHEAKEAEEARRLAAELEALERELEEARLEAERLEAELLEAERAIIRDEILAEARWLARGYFYEEALALLNEDQYLINDETKALEIEILQMIDNLVLFEDEIRHIFFHSLVLYPEHLFPNINIPTGGINEGFIFQREFIRMLPQLLERGYVLYSVHDIWSRDEYGNMQQHPIYLPPGKRPLILSIDDPTFHYGIGLANRMIIDEDGRLATEVITPERETIITHDGDIQLILNDFVREHPEFSFRGHRGIIAATGFMGIFGHDLLTEESIAEAVAVVEYLKNTGWLFANHSYTHNRVGFWGPNSNPNNIRRDVAQWRARIEPVVGPTNIFIAPFGFTLRGEGLQVVLDNGYDLYFNVDFRQPVTVYPTHVLAGRIEIGGYALVRWRDILNRDFFNVDEVMDAHRPPIISP
ncbi:MAG: hypothetical protein FWE11_05590 [Defluviitaleaceae bacterium]|nr:hypothetical protein [Defluviitaleaceae bacterium]